MIVVCIITYKMKSHLDYYFIIYVITDKKYKLPE